MITAAYGPRLDGKRTKSGFATREEAIEHISGFLCKGCLEEVEKGYQEHEMDGKTHRHPIDDAFDTSCGAEWFILSDEDWNKFNEEEKDFKFILESAGYKKT